MDAASNRAGGEEARQANVTGREGIDEERLIQDLETIPDYAGEYLVTDPPKLEAIIFAEFDPHIGPVIVEQVPRDLFTQDEFSSFSASVIPKTDMLNRMIKLIFQEHKVIGHPIGLDCTKYEREKYIFNMCFVVPRNSTEDCMYEPMVQKLAEYLTELEQISIYMVPMFIRDVPESDWPRLIEKMDVLSQKILPQIDGVRCVQEIAMKVNIDPDLVKRCIRNLVFYECVSLLPLFLYSNTYVATEQLHAFYNTEKMIGECVEFVRLRDSNGQLMPQPKFSDVFRLYLSLKCGLTLRDWVLHESPRLFLVDERRLIQFGMHHRFLRKLSIYPVLVEKMASEKLVSTCDGTNALEDLAVTYGIMPQDLLEKLTESGKFEFLSR